MLKKNLIFLTAVTLLFVSRLALAAMVTVVVGKGAGQPGENIELPITVSNLKGLGIISVDLSLEYDTSLLSFSSLTTSGTILAGRPAPTYNNAPGLLKIAIYSTKALDGKGTLLKIVFDINAEAKTGKAKVVLKKVVFNDGKITAALKNSMIKIVPNSGAARNRRLPLQN